MKQRFTLLFVGLGVCGLCLSSGLQPYPSRLSLLSTPPAIAMPQPLLDAETIRDRMQNLPGWKTDGKKLTITRKFKNFVDAIAFVNKLVEPAEAANHHPDLAISYNKVSITLTTHDAGGLTNLDFQLAEIITKID